MSHGLPARPNFSAVGPSQTRPRQTQNQNQNQHQRHAQSQSAPSAFAPQPQPQQQQYTPSSNSLPQPPPINLTGGYTPFPQVQAQTRYNAYPQIGSSSAAGYNFSFTGYQPNLTGGYPAFPVQGYAGQSFGQSLFQPQAQQNYANPSGYAYSSTYTHPSPSSSTSAPPNAKRQKPNPGLSDNSFTGSMGMAGGSDQGQTTSQMWRNCSYPGCKFVGPGNEVEIHEGDRHLIFPNGKPVERSEEEERYARRKGPPPPIQGTNITLNTPEEIEKWIAERKAKWPSAKRVQEKEEERQAAIARGDIPARGRGGKRGRGGRIGNDAAYLAEEWGRAPKAPKEPIVFGSAESTGTGEGTLGGSGTGCGGDGRWERGRGRGRGRGSERGRGSGRGRGGHSTMPGNPQGQEQDQGWPGRPEEEKDAMLSADPPTVSLNTDMAATTTTIKADTTTTAAKKIGLAGLEGYDTPSESDSGSDDGDPSNSSDSSSTTSSSSSDSDSESEIGSSEADADDENHQQKAKLPSSPVARPKEAVESKVVEVAAAATTKTKPICKFFAKNGRCKNGDRCRFAHTKGDNTTAIVTPQSGPAPQQAENRPKATLPRQPQPKRANPFERPSMLGSLLANPIENTISQLSQTIRFLVANDFLKGVELKVGDAEDQAREKNKVVDVDVGVDVGADVGADVEMKGDLNVDRISKKV
ncbi:hypothetical protein IAT40_005507 [Kwoniella sp. CBS 6097]